MTIALLATGDEIIHGDTLNTNSHYLAHALSSEGLPLGLQLSCSDKENEIHDCIEFLVKNHDVIIMIGGLGPTSDDRTRFALERFLKTKLVEFPEAIQHIQNRLRLSSKELNPGNRQQALFPSNATILPNPNGTAMGCFYPWEGKLFILLPGPPRECLPMFNDHVLPLLQQRQHSDKSIFKWRLFGVAESLIAEQLDTALADLDCKTGYRLETPYVEFKVRCKAQVAAKIKERVEPLIAPYLIASTEQKASEQLHARILQLESPISIIDEATGGLLQTLIQQPDNHHLLHFNNCHQDSTLQFHLRGLKEYWNQEPMTGKTQLSIEYSSANNQGTEIHEIAHRSALVIYFAAEWLSFRLFHLINQLHQ
ncbi:competence/damage-inducible protein A [Legionella brunensis]|uniref:Competence damage inducible protein CinA n=1 Tax=Legionella brunensis TaxID=29422 RepID=A0A0W0S150_9GAMM|nr:competence/damage-inducible protein A [Legionella brunensis]KTC77120.1 competence damage inducible protein CinA [Legionella brunensis]